MELDSMLSCSVTIEWSTGQGGVARKAVYKKATLRLCRNEVRLMMLEIDVEKHSPQKFVLRNMSVHNRFMNEGKASLNFQDQKCIVFLSNAPPGQLTTFLKFLFVKMTGEKKAPNKQSLREQLLANKPATLNDISPVTVADLTNVNNASRRTDTTPSPLSRKRKASDGARTSLKKRFVVSEPLNEEQTEVMQACLGGHNVFFTGSAGTGKSYLLRKIIGALPPDVTTATASTGVAACLIGGISLHQFAGIGGGDVSVERACALASKPSIASNWRKCKHLIIDEISMIDATYFQTIEAVARWVRKNDKPFGGIQLILCGDFLQLPPVTKTQNNGKKFCFEANAWAECVQKVFELRTVHRQTDEEFVHMLNSIRIGEVSQQTANRLKATAKQQIEKHGILATTLCSHTNEANLINESKLNELSGTPIVFVAQDSDKFYSKNLDKQTPVPGNLVLKKEAQVMLLKNVNISTGLVNGARGIVIGFTDGLPLVRFRNNKEYLAKHEKWTVKSSGGDMLTRKQVPLKLAWAFSIHKSQGLTLDCVEMSLAKVFEAGQAYVALSRATSLDSLRVLDFRASQVFAHPNVITFYRRLRQQIADDAIARTLIPLGQKSKPKSNASIAKKPKKLNFDKPIVNIS